MVTIKDVAQDAGVAVSTVNIYLIYDNYLDRLQIQKIVFIHYNIRRQRVHLQQWCSGLRRYR